MRRTFILLCLCASAAAFSQPTTTLNTTAGSFTIQSGSYTSASNTTMSGLSNYTPVTGGDHSFRQTWSYRQQGDTREYNVASPSATFVPGNPWQATLFKGPGNSNTGTPTLRFDVTYDLTSITPTAPLLHANLCVTNLTNAPIQVSAFYYLDLDIPNAFVPSISNDTLAVFGNGFLVRQSDSVNPSFYAEVLATGAVAFQHGNQYESLFTNGLTENLNNSINATFGDLVMGFQWDCVIPPGDCCPADVYVSLGAPVPEPASLLGLAIPLAVVARRRRAARKV
ncbi:MAG: hypothetical protein K1X67_21300 [Fimbriimonadaceae bacterium]|nr:hypothetical protein [Fimbriimonadaceae bacterium]